MSTYRLLAAVGVLSVAAVTACGAAAPSSDEAAVSSVTGAVAIQKTYTRKIYVHMMPWFQVGGTHWSMNHRGATGLASYYSPMIGEYSSNDGNVIEYQLLMMKYAGIDGVIIDWPGLNGANDLPQNKANADAIIGRTAEFGMEFSVCYEDQYAVSIDAAKNDMSYVRDQLFSKPNYIKVAGQPEVLVFGPQKYTNPNDWTQILSVFSTKPTLFTLWYNMNAGGSAQGQFSWVTQNALKGVSDFDDGSDGGGHGIQIPVLYPGFNPFYQEGGWGGPNVPTWKVSYSLNQDNTDGGANGDTFGSSFELGKFAGDSLQIATWNDYGEGTMIEPTNQFQYRFLTTLQKKVGTKYTDAELKIIKMLFDQRRATNGSQAAKLNMASQALANLDVATACSILGCTAPVHTGGSGAGGASGTAGSGAGGAPAAGGAPGSSGAPSKGGTTGAGGAPAAGAGAANSSAGKAGGTPVVSAGAPSTAGAGSTTDGGGSSGGCSVSAPSRPRSSALLFAVGALALASVRRRKRAPRVTRA